MRRAIGAAVVGGLVLGGLAAGPAFAALPAAATGPARPARPAGPAMKTVVFHGYAFQVPASWPVYRLDEHPQTCVRYDVHAVYLGTPGPNMICPPGLIGRTQAVSFLPAVSAAPRAGRKTGRPTQPAQPAQRAAGAAIELQRLPAVHSVISQNTAKHELVVALGAAGADGTLLGTYGTAPGVIEQVLSTLRLAPAGAVPTQQTVPAKKALPAKKTVRAKKTVPARKTVLAGKTVPAKPAPSAQVAAAVHPVPVAQRAAVAPTAAKQTLTQKASSAPRTLTRKPPAAPRTYTSWHGVPSGWPTQIVQPPSPLPAHPVAGFDACTAPPLSTMRVWRRAFAAVGAYIGGINAACAYGNLSASWIKSVAAMGWGVLPTYVGPQAPCWDGGNGVLIDPGKAAAEGDAAGVDAVNDARLFGLAAGSPIYYDMEGYSGGTTCKEAVLMFLGAWDRRVNAGGYLTGVYSSRDSGITNIEEWAVFHNPGFTPPDAIWIALWDGVAELNQGGLAWPMTAQSKQYSGSVTVSVGKIKLDIDRDIVDGPLAR